MSYLHYWEIPLYWGFIVMFVSRIRAGRRIVSVRWSVPSIIFLAAWASLLAFGVFYAATFFNAIAGVSLIVATIAIVLFLRPGLFTKGIFCGCVFVPWNRVLSARLSDKGLTKLSIAVDQGSFWEKLNIGDEVRMSFSKANLTKIKAEFETRTHSKVALVANTEGIDEPASTKIVASIWFFWAVAGLSLVFIYKYVPFSTGMGRSVVPLGINSQGPR